MSLAVVYSRAEAGMLAPRVSIEVHLSNGLPAFHLVGMPEAAVRESKERVRSALLTCGYEFPAKRITVNLAPADIPKQGGRFDLPIAMGILLASKQIKVESEVACEFAAELSLSGELRSIPSVLPLALAVKRAGGCVILSESDRSQVEVIPQASCLYASHLSEVCAHVMGVSLLQKSDAPAQMRLCQSVLDFSDVVGQAHAKRALAIAAAGGHSLLMSGPPGSGKSMLAKCLPGILPELSMADATDVAVLHSLSTKQAAGEFYGQRPFRAPHHSASAAALVGGGNPPCPGEVSLAHRGVLFLDELPEFKRHVLENLRQPMESGEVLISRAGAHVVFPASFQLIAAMNPCPCGYLTDPVKSCRCTPDMILRYQGKLSGPLLDRIDMYLEVSSVSLDDLLSDRSVEKESLAIRCIVTQVHAQQGKRSRSSVESVTSLAIDKSLNIGPCAQKYLHHALKKLRLSARGVHRILKVARTIADYECSAPVTEEHISEALSYRSVFNVYAGMA